MKLVIEVRSTYPDAQVRDILKEMDREGSYSHAAYAELQGCSTRLVVEIIGTLEGATPTGPYEIRSLEAS